MRMAVLRYLLPLWAFVILLSAEGAFVYAQDKSEDKPKTLDAAVSYVVSQLSEQDKKTVRETPKADLIKFHFSLGMSIRNDLGLWRADSELLNAVCGGKPCHPDNASMIIINGIWETLQK